MPFIPVIVAGTIGALSAKVSSFLGVGADRGKSKAVVFLMYAIGALLLFRVIRGVLKWVS